MKLSEIAVVTVPFIQNERHYNLAKSTYKSLFKHGGFGLSQMIAVINQSREEDLDMIGTYNETVIKNERNNLSMAWNVGVKTAINQGYKYVLIPNLDILLHKKAMQSLIAFGDVYIKDTGIIACNPINDIVMFEIAPDNPEKATKLIENNDQSFSCFLLSIEAYKKIGAFDEQFEPAYFEDDDYLHRAKQSGYRPTKLQHAMFWHFLQGTVKNANSETRDIYNESLEKSKRLYILKHGGEPRFETK